MRLLHRVRAEGREHLPKEPPFVVVANHSSHLDAVSISAALPARLARVCFPIAAGEVFFDTQAHAVLSAFLLNALPMWRRNCGPHALQDLRERLIDEPCGYILFPEGTRSRDGSMAAFRAGVGMLLAATDVPVVPCYIAGAFACLPPGRNWPRPGRITIRFGPALRFAETGSDRAGWERLAATLEAAVRGLAPPANLR